MRLIDADALETHEQLKPLGNGKYEYVEVIYKDDIDNAPTINQWIPVSERLPRQGQEVICQCRANIIKVLELDADGDWFQDADHCYMSGFVIAWMPLPEPWKGEEG